MKTVATIMVLSNWFTKKKAHQTTRMHRNKEWQWRRRNNPSQSFKITFNHLNWIHWNNKICTLYVSFHTETPIVHVWTLLCSMKDHGSLSMFSLKLLLAGKGSVPLQCTAVWYSVDYWQNDTQSIINQSIISGPAENWHLTTIIYITSAYYIDEKSWVDEFYSPNTSWRQ